ncbi:metallophosphatase domain-containing protein [Flavobacterium sp.]|uniref:metallophosphatase domain-containing protein n=1 Tax=Flavobacterium sp. TaxID=239 RepID=UPI001B50AC93|nr:metallophosphatase domain-containing protein [Flavobacterium sp.]MBP6128267.1 metallophosphatase domain-containing protein [Flavobacterium sp.]
MKITTLSDTHGLHHKLLLPGGDILIHAGDVCNRGTEIEALNFINWFSNQNYTYKIFIAGNHDFYFEYEQNTTIKSLLPENVFYLNDSGITIEEISFWGSPVTPEFHNMAFNRKRGVDIEKHWGLIPPDTDVLITHGPAYGILDKTFQNLNVGCTNLLTKIEEIKPKYHIFGHIHEDFGLTKREQTTFINTASVDFNYKMRKIPFFDFEI